METVDHIEDAHFLDGSVVTTSHPVPYRTAEDFRDAQARQPGRNI